MPTFFLRMCIPFLTLLLLIAPGLAAHRQRPPPPQQPAYESPFPLGHYWTLQEINGQPLKGDKPTFMIDANLHGSGFAGCNNWTGVIYPVRGQKLAAGPFAMTKKFCPAEQMRIERSFLILLHSGPVWSINGSALIIKGRGGAFLFEQMI